jgi:radical SAM superfamily enzyme YgiQ (UPF0313 family)
MKKLLIVSFDIIREGEISYSYSIASLMAYLKQSAGYMRDFEVVHHSFNVNPHQTMQADAVVRILEEKFFLHVFDFIAFSEYVWSSYVINDVIREIKSNGYEGKIVLGGYQITSTPPSLLQQYYPEADFFIKDYAEESLRKLMMNEIQGDDTVLYFPTDVTQLASVYLSGEIPLDGKVKMIRWETKRGCPYTCDYCEWKNAMTKRNVELPLQRLYDELSLFASKNISKINVLDGTFNVGKQYLPLLERMTEVPTQFNLQTHFECIKGENGERFLEICRRAKNIYLEFGVQTIIPEEMERIGRKNNVEHIRKILLKLQQYHIPYETNLIYGIPGQTPKSFQESIQFLIAHGCRKERIKCYPLRIPRGSNLEKMKEDWNIQEKSIDGIPHVHSSYSFGKEEYERMQLKNVAIEFEAMMDETMFGGIRRLRHMDIFFVHELQTSQEWVTSVQASTLRFYFISKNILPASRDDLKAYLRWKRSESLTPVNFAWKLTEYKGHYLVFREHGKRTYYNVIKYEPDLERGVCNLYVERL